MTEARLLWTPWPYQGGFCITDDTDNADLRSVRLVYDFLHSLGLRSTKTVWPFTPEEPCGIPATPDSTLRGITLEDPDYLAYCKSLARNGFEIALHGASAGNNRRERIAEAFALMEQTFGSDGTYSGTYICHSKNADNIYWEEKVAPNRRLRTALRLYSRHRAFGEAEGSPYFWGDICREKVRWIRLFRTRDTNTLKANPSMPYFEESKPYVRGWFGASKRSFHDCTTPEALDRLAAENGLTVLYQYLHRYADPKRDDVLPEFRKDAERLAADNRIWVDTTARIMERLELMQGIFIGYRGEECAIFNTNTVEVRDLQLRIPNGAEPNASRKDAKEESRKTELNSSREDAKEESRKVEPSLSREDAKDESRKIERYGSILRVSSIPPESVLMLRFNRPIRFAGKRTFKPDGHGYGSIDFGHGKFYANIGPDDRHINGIKIPSGKGVLIFREGLEELRPLSRAGRIELLGLFFGQMWIIARELILGKRSISAEKFLGEGERPLEDHSNW